MISGNQESTQQQETQPPAEPPQEQPRGQPPQGQPPQEGQTGGGGDNEEEINAAKVGTLAFAVVGLGYFILNTLVNFIGSTDAGVFSGPGDEELFFAAVTSLEELVIFAPIIAIALAFYYYNDAETTETPKIAVIASAVGLLAIGFLLLLLAIIFAPSGIDVDVGDELPGFIGTILGTVIIAGGVAYILDEDPLEVF